jgi:Tol biopolymer transport system component
MKLRQLVLSLTLLLFVSAASWAQGTRLLRQPTVSRDLVAFEYGGDLWVVSRNGGQARRLTSTPGVEADPRFSPDGTQVAFSATVAGNTDIYVIPATSGEKRGSASARRSRGTPTSMSYLPLAVIPGGLRTIRGPTCFAAGRPMAAG